MKNPNDIFVFYFTVIVLDDSDSSSDDEVTQKQPQIAKRRKTPPPCLQNSVSYAVLKSTNLPSWNKKRKLESRNMPLLSNEDNECPPGRKTSINGRHSSVVATERNGTKKH